MGQPFVQIFGVGTARLPRIAAYMFIDAGKVSVLWQHRRGAHFSLKLYMYTIVCM